MQNIRKKEPQCLRLELNRNIGMSIQDFLPYFGNTWSLEVAHFSISVFQRCPKLHLQKRTPVLGAEQGSAWTPSPPTTNLPASSTGGFWSRALTPELGTCLSPPQPPEGAVMMQVGCCCRSPSPWKLRRNDWKSARFGSQLARAPCEAWRRTPPVIIHKTSPAHSYQ